MTTALRSVEHPTDQSRSVLSNGRACARPRARLFGGMNFGPRFTEDFISVQRNDSDELRKDFSLYYRIYNPTSIRSSESPPLLIVHGGPSLPSDYLFPLVQHMPTSRSIIFYDQLGCGRSNRPEDEQMYSIENSVNDLKELINSLKLNKFHLLGHSFGGIIAYEFIKSQTTDPLIDGKENFARPCKCLSVTLANTPCNMQTSLEECARLKEEMKEEMSIEDHDYDEASLDKDIQDRLRKVHECRTEKMPGPLVNAIQSRGTLFSGPEAVSEYVALPLPQCHSSCQNTQVHSTPPVLLIRGEHDFVTEECIKGWRKIFASVGDQRGIKYREEIMHNCSHYCHLEDGQRFGGLVKNHCFINDY